MTTPLTPDEEKHYTEIIDGILAAADLETVTRNQIRDGLETALGGKDLSDQKKAIKALIGERFNALTPEEPAVTSATQASSASPLPTNGHDDDAEDDDAGADEIRVSAPAPKKKRKADDSEDADAKLAAMLQAQENSRTRATRGGGTSKAKSAKTSKKATPRKKSAKKVKAEDDSDVDGDSSEAATKKKSGGGFQKPFNLSYALAEVCGEPQLSRTQVVKKIWEYIRAHDLQDPSDRRQIRCDEKMVAVFDRASVGMFQMNKILSNHLYPIEEGA